MSENLQHSPSQFQWQPIETAPKDGTDILAYSPKAPDPKIRTTWWRRAEDGKGYIGWGEFNAPYWPPTHWMPLPPLPAAHSSALPHSENER